MSTSPHYQFPYPDPTDSPDAPKAYNELSDAVQAEIDRIDAGGSFPFGVVARARRTTNLTPGSQASFTQYRAMTVSASVTAGRSYRVQAPCAGWFSTAYALIRPSIRYTTNGSAPTGSSPTLMETGLELSNSNNVESATLTGYFQPTANGTLRASLFWQRTQGGSAVTSYGLGDWPLNLYIEDLGKI